MNQYKYHRDVFFPKESVKHISEYFINLPPVLKKTLHVQNERWWKHDYEITKNDLKPKDIFELAYEDGVLCKVGFRIDSIDPENDVVYIISCQGNIVTSWLNKKGDTHKTLDEKKYKTEWVRC